MTNWIKEDFWRNTHGNFIDVAVLEWCKLFADGKKGKHYWARVVPNPDSFLEGLYKSLDVSDKEFDQQIEKMKYYRDKFLAHLDEERKAHIAAMEISISSTVFLFDTLLGEFAEYLHDAPKKLQEFYEERIFYAKSQYPAT